MDTSTTAAQARARACSSSTDRHPGLSLCAVAIGVALASCASGDKLSTIPSDGPTMAEIYRAHMAGTGQLGTPADHESGWRVSETVDRTDSDAARPSIVAEASAAVAAVAELQQRFTRLPNPDLVMYVTPHLSPNGRYPVPGYTTVFPLYETVEYALPGEVTWRRPVAGR